MIDPWLCSWFRRPATWSCRSRRKDIRCLICVADYLRERDPQERRRMMVSARFVFKDQLSQSCSIAMHVIACHDDMGKNRICVACNKRCASEQGAFIHQTTRCKQLEHLQPSSQPSTATGASSSTTVTVDPMQQYAELDVPTHPSSLPVATHSSYRPCVVCMNGDPVCAILPCGHRALCENCAREGVWLQHCPICRQKIQRVAVIYDI